MVKTKFTHSIIIICFFSLTALAQTDKNQILVLGTSHLEQLKGFEISMLDKVIDKLDSFNFEVICIEKMSGELLYGIQSRQDSSFDQITKGRFGSKFLKVADTVQSSKSISYLKAEKNIKELSCKSNLNVNQRKELLFNYLAITDLPSAVLQYAYIKDKVVFTSNFDKYIANLLEKSTISNNEYYSLAVSLAKRENINQIEPIDNFQDEALLLKYYPDFIKDYQDNFNQINDINQLPVYQKLNQLTQECLRTNDLSDLYTFLNSDEYKKEDYNGQWKIWLKTNFPSHSDKARYSFWEMRNLQITANIMRVVARNPGKKLIVIIGASHKSFVEKYLEQIEHVEVLKY
ncbi:DUF5694 domain-containing protein [Reichenbachiella versicolor]|uniref:DUF5694 domain-containing protein n=1 Tax=Reichenbachiella versicolor TaxID=1821036 RepID=UPI000D6E7F03|nr:DUF5694 domain-containing protein [Reichenbachiella versicolor]